MPNIDSFQDLTVWQKSMDLAEIIYKLTTDLPPEEKFGLSSQLRRAAVSIPSNIAEGSKRGSRADFRQFCIVALGSAAEIEAQLLLIGRLFSDIRVDAALIQIIEVQKMLTSLTQKLAKPVRPAP